MSTRSLFSLLLGCMALISPGMAEPANTTVAASEYALHVTHVELSRASLGDGLQGLELQLSIENHGSHDLYDVRIYLQEAAAEVLPDHREPAHLRTLSAGEIATLTWTFESVKQLTGPLRNVVFRVEAVDQATKQIVQFNQKSAEAR